MAAWSLSPLVKMPLDTSYGHSTSPSFFCLPGSYSIYYGIMDVKYVWITVLHPTLFHFVIYILRVIINYPGIIPCDV